MIPDDNDYIKRLIQEQTEPLRAEVSRLRDEMEELMDIINPKPQPFMQQISQPDCQRIVKLRIDLFYNEQAKQGKPKWNYKTFVWFDNTRGAKGHVMPLHFHASYQADIAAGDSSLWANAMRRANGEQLVGCVLHAGKHVKGKVKVKDHVIIELPNNELWLIINQWHITITAQEFKQVQNESITIKPRTPIKTWYWNKP